MTDLWRLPKTCASCLKPPFCRCNCFSVKKRFNALCKTLERFFEPCLVASVSNLSKPKENCVGQIRLVGVKKILYDVFLVHSLVYDKFMQNYVFWNNKGGTGKTSLAFQAICRYANKNPDKQVLAIDMCPQANLSELFLGGLDNNGSRNLLARQGLMPRCSVGGYFQLRLPAPFSIPIFSVRDFLTKPFAYNSNVPENIDLFAGDPLLELQANAINTLANTQIPGTDTWVKIIDWLKDALDQVIGGYDIVFIDTNPSFSIYTQIAISTASRLVLPVMADDSSRRAIQNAFSLVYGLKLPSDIYSEYAFATKLELAGRSLPQVHVIVKNRITQYMGSASAYAAVLRSIEEDVTDLIHSNPKMFTFNKIDQGVVEIRDFQTTGVVSFARGCPFYEQPSGKLTIGTQRVQVKEEYRQNCINAIDAIVNKF
jgi:cellulose biosynthesis protein BcsQ